MKPFNARTDIFALAARHAPSKACVTAISENRATLLGGFTPAGGLPRFIVSVTSKRGKQWNIAIIVDEEANRYRIEWPETVPWASWDGRINGKRLIDGDEPTESAFKRMQERRRHGRDTEATTAEEDHGE